MHDEGYEIREDGREGVQIGNCVKKEMNEQIDNTLFDPHLRTAGNNGGRTREQIHVDKVGREERGE